LSRRQQYVYAGQPLHVRFNNPLYVEKVANDLVTVTPEIAGMVVSAAYDGLSINGLTAGRTTYQVTIGGELEDIFGQTLGEAVTLTFYTGNMRAFMTGPNQTLVTLDPTATTPAFPVYSVNIPKLRVRGYAVTPADWPAYLTYLNEYYRDPNRTPPGKRVIDATVDVDAAPDTLTETNIDLTSGLNGRYGHVIVVVDTPPSLLGLIFPNRNEPVIQSWVQVTNIGLDAIHDQVELAAWANGARHRRAAGRTSPLTLAPSSQTATTDADGMARFTLASTPDKQLIATLGDDVAFLPQSTYYWSDYGWQKMDRSDQSAWFVFDDRQMYRPTEEVHLKGWVRTLSAGPTGDVRLDAGNGAFVDYLVTDPQGNQLAQGSAPMTDLGGFDLAFTIPENSNLGYASVQLSTRNTPVYGSYYHSFQIQEFRRPEFEVTARNESTGPYFLGDEAIVAVSAQYYAGGPLPSAETNWTVSANATNYTPPNWDEFIFGEWTPWWWRGYGDFYPGMESGSGSQSYAARTDPTGNHYLKMTFIAAEKPQPYSVSAEAAVMDVNRQTWAAQTNLLVHPSKLYVGLRSAAYFVEQGDPLAYEAIVTDVDGNAVADVPFTVRSVRLAWVFENGKWVEQEVDEQRCELTSAADPVTCTLPTGDGGQYRVTAEVRDDAERPQPHGRDGVGQRRRARSLPRPDAARAGARARQRGVPARRHRAHPGAGALPERNRLAHRGAQRHPHHRELHTRRRHGHAGNPHRGRAHSQPERAGRCQRRLPAAGRQGPAHRRCARPARLRHRHAATHDPAAESRAGGGDHPRRHQARSGRRNRRARAGGRCAGRAGGRRRTCHRRRR
jgi:uncharacterized protein YfaS (alpha-2-macroglobulin family)